jgi:hypothetical protein
MGPNINKQTALAVLAAVSTIIQVVVKKIGLLLLFVLTGGLQANKLLATELMRCLRRGHNTGR